MTTSTYTVTGMTCGHCVSAVKQEVSALVGITNVDVDLASGALTVSGSNPIDRDVVRQAVEEAGYDLADSSAPAVQDAHGCCSPSAPAGKVNLLKDSCGCGGAH